MLAASRTSIGRLADMMADGIGDYAEMKGRLATALAERGRSTAGRRTPRSRRRSRCTRAWPRHIAATSRG